MKTKKLDKKLSLKKSTVSHLDNKDLNHVKGGVVPTGITCPGHCNTFITCGPTKCTLCVTFPEPYCNL